MSFDKQKAMRNAERFLSQGKIRLAITEYASIIEDNPRDFSTLNILGDLFYKNSEIDEAVKCFRQVAEHYNSQGFANKAIAVYNKVSKLKPDSMEIAAKLAQLYQVRGSLAEAREQYVRLAESYQNKGQKIEALAIWKQIAELDPHNTDVYLRIAESCLLEHQPAQAAESFTEAGLRLHEQGDHEGAVAAFVRAIEIKSNDLKSLKGFVAAKISLESADEAAATLESIFAENTENVDILDLLAECYLDIGNDAMAEETIIKLVQRDTANFPKFLDVIKLNLKIGDLDSAVRNLAVSAENLMVGGHADEFAEFTREVLARNPEHIEALQLMIRYQRWNRDDDETTAYLERLAECALANEDIVEEKTAVAQLVMIHPKNAAYSSRLSQINLQLGIEDPQVEDAVINEKVPEFETFIALNEDEDDYRQNDYFSDEFSAYDGEFIIANESDKSYKETAANPNDSMIQEVVQDPAEASNITLETGQVTETADALASEQRLDDESRFQKELESIEFYIAQGYIDLAATSLGSLEAEFGMRDETSSLRHKLGMPEAVADNQIEPPTVETAYSGTFDENAEILSAEYAPQNVFEQFRSELGLDDAEESPESDYSTHYQMAIAYKEMGLMEEAIKEFQQAINLSEIADGSRRYFQCANLLGHCFMMQSMPNLAQTWYKRALETPGLNEDEIQALNYELASAYEESGERELAVRYFEQVYALDVDYRDIGRRIESLRGNQSRV